MTEIDSGGKKSCETVSEICACHHVERPNTQETPRSPLTSHMFEGLAFSTVNWRIFSQPIIFFRVISHH